MCKKRLALKSVSELLSALCSAAGKYLAAVSGGHSLAEAVLFFTMQLLGLIGSEHSIPLRFVSG